MKSTLAFIILFFCLNLQGQERYANIDGQKFLIKESGVGNVTVIFESGMPDSLEAWGSIPDTVASYAHVFLYDRADIGKSDSSRLKRIIPNMVYMKNLNMSKDLPIILVYASKSNWYKYHKKIIIGFKNARITELEGGHYIHRDHPDLILKYIKELTLRTN